MGHMLKKAAGTNGEVAQEGLCVLKVAELKGWGCPGLLNSNITRHWNGAEGFNVSPDGL